MTSSVSTPDLSPSLSITLTFSDPGDFAAASRAVNLLEAAGFSVGYPQRGAPRGILFGLYDIQKWRNLSKEHRRALHGVMTGDMRCGPVTVEIFASAPDAAKAAIGKAETTHSLHRPALAAPVSVNPVPSSAARPLNMEF